MRAAPNTPFVPGGVGSVSDEDETSVLQSLPAFLRGVSRPLGRILAGSLAVVVVFREVQLAVVADCDEGFIGLKCPAVLHGEVVLVRHRTITARAGEVGNVLNSTEESHERGASDCLHILVLFDYITKIVNFPLVCWSLALKKSWLFAHKRIVEIPESPPEEVGVVLVPIIHEIPELRIVTIHQFTLIVIVEQL